MAARDRWEKPIHCSKCGQDGLIGLSQDDHPFMSRNNWETEIDYVKGEFTAEKKFNSEVLVKCKKCGNETPI